MQPVSAARPLTATPTGVTASQLTELDAIKQQLQQTEQRLVQEIDARNQVQCQVIAAGLL